MGPAGGMPFGYGAATGAGAGDGGSDCGPLRPSPKGIPPRAGGGCQSEAEAGPGPGPDPEILNLASASRSIGGSEPNSKSSSPADNELFKLLGAGS